jgi:hypothetical protein
MGILHRAGVNVGQWNHRGTNIDNPGGFYETKAISDFTYKNMTDQKLPFKPRPTWDEMRGNKQFKGKLDAIFEKDYTGRFPIAIKDMHMTMIPMFENDDSYDVRIIYLSRNIHDQACSIQKVWRSAEWTADRFVPWLKKMYAWMGEFKNAFPMKSIDINFNSLINDPVETATKICDFCEIQLPGPDTINQWIRPEWSRSRTN